MMSYPFSRASIFAPSEVLYILKDGLWANWRQSLCNPVFVFHAKEHKLSSLIFVVCFVTIASFELQNVVPVVLKPAAGDSYKGTRCVLHTSDSYSYFKVWDFNLCFFQIFQPNPIKPYKHILFNQFWLSDNVIIFRV